MLGEAMQQVVIDPVVWDHTRLCCPFANLADDGVWDACRREVGCPPRAKAAQRKGRCVADSGRLEDVPTKLVEEGCSSSLAPNAAIPRSIEEHR